MTPYVDGDINSGLANVIEVFGYDSFAKPGNLTWYETATQIDAAGVVVTDLIMAAKTRVENGIVYVYAVGHTGRVYKIQVNDPATFNPNYDNPVLLTTLVVDTPTFTRGGFIDFFGATEKIYIGHDKGVTSVNFDGTGEAAVGVSATWSQNVPRPLQQFLGNLYVGNGTNIAEIGVTAIVNTYTKLAPAFPTGSQVRDLDVTPDGNYLQIVVAELALGDVTSTAPPTALLSPADSFLFSWNGTDTSYTAYTTYPAATMSANHTFANQQYLFGYDFLGGGVWNPTDKFLSSLPLSAFGEAPSPNGVFSGANLVYWATPLPFNGFTEMLITMYGNVGNVPYDVPPGYFAPYGQAATGTETDVLRIPYAGIVSNFAQGASSNGYTNNITGEPKLYFSTLETSAAPTTKYKLYKWSLAPSGLGTALAGAIYQTQNQIFSKKVQIKEVRLYGEPWIAGNSFTVELIGSGGAVLSGSSKTFTAGSNLTVGNDFAWYTPQTAPTYTIGLRITNEGATNHVISKVEIDYELGGK